MTVDTLRDILGRYVIRFGTEAAMQADVERILQTQQIPYTREHRLKPGPIDFLADGRIGIECKIAGSKSEVLRQCRGYIGCNELESLLLVTKRAGHATAPATLGDKPFRVLWVAGRAL